MTAVLVGAGLSLAWLVAIFVPMEWARPAWPGQRRVRRGTATDLCFFLGQHLVFASLAATVLGWLTSPLTDLAAAGSLRQWFLGQPIWLAALEALVLGDVVAYFGHRLQHRVDVLWRFHAVHHTAEELDFLAAHREHPLDGLYTQALVNLPAILLDLPLAPLFGLVAFRSLWAILIHANVRLPLGPLGWLVGSPHLHHWHHARSRDAGNYANLAPWLDRLFGTHVDPPAEPTRLGIEEAHPRGYLALLGWSFRRGKDRRLDPRAGA
jgi:sterol desaturase/sphingolipid hydroxylase (fatty acid hydroxylase superfamily)